MDNISLFDVAETVAEHYKIHVKCLSNSDNTKLQQQARQVFTLVAVRLDYSIAEIGKQMGLTAKQTFSIARLARKHKAKSADVAADYNRIMNVLIAKGAICRTANKTIDLTRYNHFVHFTAKEQAEIARAKLAAAEFMSEYGKGASPLIPGCPLSRKRLQD